MSVKKEKEKAFPEANIPFLKSTAGNMGLEVKIPRDIREAQKLKDAGVPLPFKYDPEEAYLISKICEKIKEEGANSVPDGLVVYFNDRGITNIPEIDFPTTLFRETKIAENNLMNALSQSTKLIK